MNLLEKSILNNVIYLDIETTGLDELSSEIIEIGAIKVKDSIITIYRTLIKPVGKVPSSIYELCSGLLEADLENAPSLQDIKKDLLSFIEDYPLICHNGGFEKKFLREHIKELKNEILDSMELAAILEPWRGEYNLEALLKKITNLDKTESHRGLEDSIDTMKAVNALLCRQFNRDENNNNKKKASLYSLLIGQFGLKTRWSWTKYLERPLLFTSENYNYVSYEENKDIKPKLKKIHIPYEEQENLLKRKDVWNNGGDFGYDYREEQRYFTEKIRENIESEGKIFIEAPTGSGKTFAYVLIAAIKSYINKNKNKVQDASFIISTDTKELQNQLIIRDIPNILSKLGLDTKLNYGAIKGKSNYICTDRLIKCQSFNGALNSILAEIFLKRLCKDGEYGDVENISYWAYRHFELEEYLRDIVCDSEECNIERCYRNCYLKTRYNELPLENITVINHSLLASWPYGEKKKITNLIIDEAHNLMEKCYDFFSEEFRSKDFSELLKNIIEKEPTIYRQLTTLNGSYGYRETIDLDKIKYWISEIETSMAILLNKTIEFKLSGGEYNFRSEFFLPPDVLKEKVRALEDYISLIKEKIYGLYSLLNKYISNITLDGEEGIEDKEYIAIYNYIMKLKGAFQVIDIFIENQKEFKSHAKIMEIASDYSYFVLTNTPLNVDELVNEHILKDVKSTTFLSATMRINRSFGRIKGVLGQREAKELIVPPTFNLKDRTKIFSVKDIGKYDSPSFVSNVAQFVFEMGNKLQGHILVLFTNNLRRKAVERALLELTCGTRMEVHMDKKSIKYLSDKNRQVIILGSKGFFEGIDVPGDGLSCVMIDKIPNKSLEDPLLKAVTSYENKNYNDVNYPQVCIKLKQAYGRLIRSTMDYGYFCILDGGQNINTINRLENDLLGPKFINYTKDEILKDINKDYLYWKKDNLNEIIKSVDSNSNDYIDSFNSEALKKKSFWSCEVGLNEQIIYKNLDLILD